MLRPTRSALAVGLCLVGVVGLVGPSFGQQKDPQVKGAVAKSGTAPATANTAAAAPKAASIGSIDMDKVLMDYDKFKVANETIRAEAQERHASLMKIAAEIKSETEKYERLNKTSPDAKKCEDKVTQLQAQFEAGRKNAEREFTVKEAETMAAIYNEIAQMTRAIAKQRGMTFVVKYSDVPASGSDPNSVVAAMSRTILFADESVDLTPTVSYWLNQRYKESGAPAPKNVIPALPGQGAAPVGNPATRQPANPNPGGN